MRIRVAVTVLVVLYCTACGGEATTTPPQPGSGEATSEVVEVCEEYTRTATRGPVPSAASPEPATATDCTTPTLTPQRAGARESAAPAKPASALLSGCMGLWSWMSTLDERLGIRRRRGPFDCAWCVRNEHGGCTGVAVRPRIPGGTASSIHRLQAENDACACHLRGHQVQR